MTILSTSITMSILRIMVLSTMGSNMGMLSLPVMAGSEGRMVAWADFMVAATAVAWEGFMVAAVMLAAWEDFMVVVVMAAGAMEEADIIKTGV